MPDLKIASLLVITTCMGLGACSAKHDTTDASGSSTATTNVATGAKMPRAGLWEMTTNMAGMPRPMIMQVCMGAPAPGANPFMPPPQPGQSCARHNVTPTGSGYAIDMECSVNGMTMTTTGTVSGDFTNNFKTEMTGKMAGPNIPPQMQVAHSSTMEAKYVGACPTGMTPGMGHPVDGKPG